MNNSALRLAVLLMAGVVCSTPTHAADRADTTRTMKRLSAKAADEKVRRDLLSILQRAGKFTSGNRIRVSGMPIDTIPYSAGVKGLCRMDELFLVYASPVNRRHSVDDPLQPVGIEAQRLFHAAEGPLADFDDTFARTVGRSEACWKLQSDKAARWFSATDEREAARGVNVLLAAAAAVRSGQLKATDCDARQFSMTCEEKISQLGRASEIFSVEKDRGAAPDEVCYNFSMTGSVRLKIVASFQDQDALNPTKIHSVSAVQLVVAT